MKSWHFVVAAWITLSSLSYSAPQQQPVFRSSVDVVAVDVAVRQGKRPATGLTAADFGVTDNGVAQTVDAVTLERVPIDATLLVDVSGSVEGDVLEHLKAGVRDVAHLLRPEDRVRLISIRQSLEEVFPFQPGGGIPDLTTLASSGATSLIDGLVAAMMQATPGDRRQLIIAYTDGRDTTSILGAGTATRVALLSDAVVHIMVPAKDLPAASASAAAPTSSAAQAGDSQAERVIDSFGAKSASAGPGAQPAERVLRDVAERTGGRLFLIDTRESIADAFKGALADFRAGYLLRYTPHGVKPDGWHDIVVAVKRPGRFEIWARKGYVGV
jgi:hypothetical protein